MKVLHLPTTVGGMSSALSKALKARGVHSVVWTLNQNYLGYPVDRSITNPADGGFRRIVKLVLAGGYVWRKWDIVHFNSGSTLFSVRFSGYDRASFSGFLKSTINGFVSFLQKCEVGILRLRGVKLLIHYQGDDARQGDVSRQLFDTSIATQVEPGYYTDETDEFKRQQIKFLTPRCEKTYAVNPDLLHVLPAQAEFIPYAHVQLELWAPVFSQDEKRPLRILHAPSHRRVKGTQIILDGVAQLKSEGYEVELILVEGKSHEEAMELYKHSDILVDQLFAGWYGGLAVELMAMGKPVMAFIRSEDLVHIPTEMAKDLPILRTTPKSFAEDLRAVLSMPRSRLVQIAKASRNFVETWHDPEKITDRILADYQQALGVD